VVDLAAGKVVRRITGLSKPQGVAYVPFLDSVFVANAGDGWVRVLRGEDLATIGRIELGDDADNVRIGTSRNQVLMGYGKGALAVIDPVGPSKTADIRLKAHPEGFLIDETEPRSLSMCRMRVRSSWPTLQWGRRDRCQRKGPDRIFRWRSPARRSGSWSSLAVRRA
jgi:hypothetical protein